MKYDIEATQLENQKEKDRIMGRRIAKFEKVSRKEFENAFIKAFPELEQEEINVAYDNLTIPRRATKGSAGYDFFAPTDFCLKPGESIKIPTGIRVKIDESWVLKLYPRSSLGFRYRLQLNNTVGIIDSDYYDSDNEGHIFVKIINDNNENKSVSISAGSAFVQGVFVEYGLTVDDVVEEKRTGGMGSTRS